MKLNREYVICIDLEQSEYELKEMCENLKLSYDEMVSIKNNYSYAKIFIDFSNSNISNKGNIIAITRINNEENRKYFLKNSYIEKILILQDDYIDLDNSDKDFLLSLMFSNVKKKFITLDSILDKISCYGLMSLTKEEMDKLESYKKL